MIRLTVISNTMPYQTGIVETSKWSRTSGGFRPTFSKMVKFGSFYGRLDASETYARAWEAMTVSARLECLEGLVPKQWEVEPAEEAGRFFSRFFRQAPSEIGGDEDESLEPPTQVAKPAEWTCSKCGAKNSGKFCPKCGTAAPKPEPPKPRWKCECGSTNAAESKFCENCGKGKPEPRVESKKLAEMTVDELFEILDAKDAADAAAANAGAGNAPQNPPSQDPQNPHQDPPQDPGQQGN